MVQFCEKQGRNYRRCCRCNAPGPQHEGARILFQSSIKFSGFGQNSNFSSNDKKILGKMMTKTTKKFFLGVPWFWDENWEIWDWIQVMTFFFREQHDFRMKFGLLPRMSDNFFVLSVKYEKIMIWANVTKCRQNFIAPKFFWLIRLCP